MVDDRLIFSDAQAVTDTKISANTIDLGAIGQVGAGTQLFINIYCDTAFSVATETFNVRLVTSTAACTAGSTVVMEIMPETACAATAAGWGLAGLKEKVPLPSLGLSTHLGILYTVDTAVATGKITAFLSLN